MKQKKIGNKLYVFELEPYVISDDTDATVVYVQNHVYDAYKELNPSLNIKRYNYNVIGVNKPEWYDYIAASDEEPETWTTPTLYFSIPDGNETTMAFGMSAEGANIPNGLVNPDNLPVEYSISTGSEYATINYNNYLMPNPDLQIGSYNVEVVASYAGDSANHINQVSATQSWTITVYVRPNETSEMTTPTLYFNNPTNTISITVEDDNGSSLENGLYLEDLNDSGILYNPENLPVTYSISVGSEYAYIDASNALQTYSIYTAGEYQIELTANYSGDGVMYNPTSATKTWTIIVSEENDTPSETEPAFVPTTYSFESFNSNDHSVKYGTGKVQTTEDQVEGYTIVIVTENTFDQYLDTPFVGRTFGISNSAQPADGQYWPLYEWDTTLTPTEVDVKVYNEDMIPSEAEPSEEPLNPTPSNPLIYEYKLSNLENYDSEGYEYTPIAEGQIEKITSDESGYWKFIINSVTSGNLYPNSLHIDDYIYVTSRATAMDGDYHPVYVIDSQTGTLEDTGALITYDEVDISEEEE